MIQAIAHSQIRPSDLNPRKRFDADTLDELAESILTDGLLQNLVVRPNGDGYEIAAGERRWRAIKALIDAGQVPADYEVPAVVRDLSDLQLLQLATTENMARADMHPLEEARAFARMLELGSDVETIVAETGLSLRTVRTRLALIERLAPAAIEELEAGTITLGQAQALTTGSPAAQERILARPRWGSEDGRLADSPAGIRREFQHSAIPVSRAKFRLEEYTGTFTSPSIFDVDGEDTFDDVEQFRALQTAYVDQLLIDYQARWGWAIIADYYDRWEYPEPAKSDRASDSDLGVVIAYSTRDGTVEVHEGLIKRKQQQAAAAPERDPLALTQRHLGVINEHRTHALQAAIVDHPAEWPALITVNMLLLRTNGWAASRLSGVGAKLDDAAPAVQAAVDELEAHSEVHCPLIISVLRGSNTWIEPERIMQELLLLGPAELQQLLRILTALHVQVGGPWGHTPDAAVSALFHAAGAQQHLPTFEDLGSDYLSLYSSPRLEQIALDLAGRPLAGTRKAIISAALAQGEASGTLDQVPTELLIEQPAGEQE